MKHRGAWDELKYILRLSLSLAKVRFKLRNEGSFIGFFWYLLEPLLIFTIFFLCGKALRQTEIPAYPLYLFMGIVTMNFFLAVTNFSIKAITSNARFIKNMNIPLEPLVISGLIQFTFSHVFELILLMGLAWYLKVSLVGFLAYPIFFVFFGLFVLGTSFLLATVGVYISDIINVWNVLGRALWFATPIFYSAPRESLLNMINLFNPLYYFISTVREMIVYNRVASLDTCLFIIVSSILVFALGLFSFEARKKYFANRL